MAEAFLPLSQADGSIKILRGKEITAHHRKWRSASYHCPICGYPIDSLKPIVQQHEQHKAETEKLLK